MKRVDERGFTLIELLVVIAIIALLLAILMPALGKVKAKGREIVCRSNFRTWMYAFNLYNNDNDDKYWPGYYSPNPNKSLWWMDVLRPYFQDIDEIRCCPTATKVRVEYNSSGTAIPGPGAGKHPFAAWGKLKDGGFWVNVDGDYGSYLSNGWVEDKWPDLTSDDPGASFYKGNFWRRSSSIKQPNRVPLMTEGQHMDAWPQAGDVPPPTREESNWGISHFVRIVQDRHGGRQSVLFADGSVNAAGLKELWTFKWHRNYDTAGKWTLAGGVQKSDWPEWMQGLKDF